MNEITIHGNVTADPVLRYRQDSDATAFLSFTVAVNRGCHSRRTGGWVPPSSTRWSASGSWPRTPPPPCGRAPRSP
jgi:hypothetical protein